MDYNKHYNALIEQAQKNTSTGYSEQHHIVPRCLGGTDDKENIVRLTPEQHYVAHQLLVKMYPDNQKLVYALNKMTQGRSSNKRYGWVRRRWQEVCKQRTGEKNGSYGKSWYYNPDTLENGKFLPEDVPEGWVKGRVINNQEKHCLSCGKVIGLQRKTKKRYCSKACWPEKRTGKKHTDTEFETLYNEHLDTGKSLRSLADKYGFNRWTVYDYAKRYTGV